MRWLIRIALSSLHQLRRWVSARCDVRHRVERVTKALVVGVTGTATGCPAASNVPSLRMSLHAGGTLQCCERCPEETSAATAEWRHIRQRAAWLNDAGLIDSRQDRRRK